MAVLGHRGKLWLRREAPDPVVLPTTAVHLASNAILVRNPGYWSGDQVTIVSTDGLPVDGGSGQPGCPDGHAMYRGGPWQLGANRAHISSDADTFYAENDAAAFYLRSQDVGLAVSRDYFIYRDQLDRLSFYTSQAAALRGASGERVPLFAVDFDNLILAPLGSEAYQSALELCVIGGADDESSLASVCSNAPVYQPSPISPADCNSGSPSGDCGLWSVQGQLSEWNLNLTAQEVDTTAVGEKFGDSIKSLITGGGQLDFLVAREHLLDPSGASKNDTTILMRLLLMSEKGCKADAQFWMIDDQADAGELLPGDLYYSTQLLVTSMAINTRAPEIIAGSLNFVTVGEIALKMGTD